MIETNTMLSGALTRALETMAFLTSLPLDEDMVPPENLILARICFSGPKNGTIQILAGMDFAKVLAGNIGALDAVSDETALDGMKELSNVACGLLLPLIGSSPAEVFNVTIPTVLTGRQSPPWDRFAAEQGVCLLDVEGHLIAAKLTTDV